MMKVQEPTVRKTLTMASSRIPWQPLIGLLAGIVLVSVVVLSGQELKHVPPASPSFVVLHSFDGADGWLPSGGGAGLIQDALGNLYGTTEEGGASDRGVVYKLGPSGTETILYSFTGGADGATPLAGLVRDAAGNLYGTTLYGATSNACAPEDSCGVVFKVSPSGTETVLHTFSNTDGQLPQAGLVRDAAGNLYGTTFFGGAHGAGVVFELIRCNSGYDFKVLYSFTGGADGGYPQAGLIRDTTGNLYGTTWNGGTKNGECGGGACGVVFRLSPSGSETVLYSFTGGADGANPSAGLVLDAAGNLYGTTYHGGAQSGACQGGTCGVVFKLGGTDVETVLHTFSGGADGGNPTAGLVRDAAGNLYGTTPLGGAESGACQGGTCGVVFRLSATGSETVLHSFTGGADGANPSAGLVLDAAGNLYGTTGYGGANSACPLSSGCGVVFRLAP
jgi:uncharacterized repeat protein (TIGR03803 family)